MPRENLTDRYIKTRKPAPIGKQVDYPDAVVPGLALRVTSRGSKSFVLIARYPLFPKNRPVTEIAPQEVSAAIRAIVKRGAPYQAHNAFGYLRKLFNWAIGTGEYGIDA